MTTLSYKVEDIIRAIEINGYAQTRGSFIRSGYPFHELAPKERIHSACALGQGALNTGLSIEAFQTLAVKAGMRDIIEMNDGYGFSLTQIAARYKERLSDNLNQVLSIDDRDFDVKENWANTYSNYQGVKVHPLEEDGEPAAREERHIILQEIEG